MSIESNVLKSITRPSGYLRTKVIRLWDNKYRVNIWATREDSLGTKDNYIYASFFVVYDAKTDSILRSKPQLNCSEKEAEELCAT